MPKHDPPDDLGRKKRRIKFGIIESFLLIFLLVFGGQSLLDYHQRTKSAQQQAEKLFLRSSRSVQCELERIRNAAALILHSAQAYREAGILAPKNIQATNTIFTSHLRQYPFITSVNFGDGAGNGYLLLRTDKENKNRIKRAKEDGIVTWLTLDEQGKIGASERVKDDYDPRTRPWYQNSINYKEIVWSSPYQFRTTGDIGITASLWLGNENGLDEVVAIDIMLKDLSRYLATLIDEKGATAYLIDVDGTMLASSDLNTFALLLQQKKSVLPRVGMGNFSLVDQALIANREETTFWTFTLAGEKIFGLMESVSFTPKGKFKLLFLVPMESFLGEFVQQTLWRLVFTILLLAIASGWYISRFLLPLRKINTALKEVGAGKFVKLPVNATRTDEIGELTTNFLTMSESLNNRDERLREQKEFTEKLINNSAVATFVLDPQHKVIFWNKACEELTGLHATDLIGSSDQWRAFYDAPRPTLADIVLEADLDRLPDLYDATEKSTLIDNGLHAERWNQRLNGQARYISFDAAPIHDDKGTVLAVVESIQDITRLKRAEESLRENSNRLSVILDGINALIYVADMETYEILFVNKFGREIWGEIIGKTCWKVLQCGQSGPCSFCTNDRLLNAAGEPTGVYLWEFQNTITGNWYDCRDQAIRWSDGRLVRMEIATDITARKEGEKHRLLQSTALQAAANAIAITDRSGTIEWVNPAFTLLTGYTSSEAIGKNPRELLKSGVHDPAFYQKLWQTLQAGEVWRGEMVNRHKDGSLYPEGQTITPVMDKDGNITHFIAIKRDLTEQHKLEAHLQHAQKMESVGTLAGGIAHDFNNILTAIIGYGTLVLMKMEKDDPNRLPIEHMLEASDRAAHLTKDLLLFSRKQATNKKHCDLNLVVAKVEKFLIRVIGEDIACQIVLPDAPVPVFADDYQLEQVLMNLATNARDAMPQGGALTITTGHTVLDGEFVTNYGFGQPGSYALITVTDTGTGMDDTTRRRIFEPFFTTKEVGKGTGLGLAVAYGIIQQHDGFINVYSESGTGTTFRIYLPLITATADTEHRPAEQDIASVCGTETILLAEDDEFVREMTSSVLTDFSYTIIAAVDGADAVKKFAEHNDSIDLLLLDLIMPKMNGKEALDEIRKIRPGIKAIFSSGYAPETIQQKTAPSEGVHLITKPASPMELLKKVRQVLDEKAT